MSILTGHMTTSVPQVPAFSSGGRRLARCTTGRWWKLATTGSGVTGINIQELITEKIEEEKLTL